MEQFQFKVIKSFDQWRTIREDWNVLIRNSSFPNIFMTWEWLAAWSEAFLGTDRSLFIIAVYEKKELISVAPFCVRNVSEKLLRFKQLEFLGKPETGSDYLDVPIKRGKEKVITNALFNFLCEDACKEWDKLWLNDIPSNSTFLNYFMEIMNLTGKYSKLDYSSYCPIFALPEDEEQLFDCLSTSRRKKYKQDIRNLKKMCSFEHLCLPTHQSTQAISTFFELYEKKTPYKGDKLHKQINNLVKHDHDGKSVQIDLLKAGDHYIGGLLHLRYEDTLYLYLMAIDKEFNPKISLGNLLVGLCITNAVRSGLKYYDFLKGAEDYKFHWANLSKSSISITFSQRKLIAISHTLKDIAKSTLKLLLR